MIKVRIPGRCELAMVKRKSSIVKMWIHVASLMSAQPPRHFGNLSLLHALFFNRRIPPNRFSSFLLIAISSLILSVPSRWFDFVFSFHQ